jgi:hypothetical protein
MTFFYDLNKRLAALADKQDAKTVAPKSKLAESMNVVEASEASFAMRDAAKDFAKKWTKRYPGNPNETAAKNESDYERFADMFVKNVLQSHGEELTPQALQKGRSDLDYFVNQEFEMSETKTKSYSAKNAAAGKDIGKPGKMFSKIAKSAGKEYGSKAAGQRVAGAVLNKLRAKESVSEGSMKDAMWRDAERMSIEQFVSKYGDEAWVREFYNNIMGSIDETASKAATSVRNTLTPYADKIADIIDDGRLAVMEPNFLDNPNDINQYTDTLLTMSNLFRKNPMKGLKYLGTLWSEIQEMTIGEVRDQLKIDLGQMYNQAFPNTGRSFEEGNAFTGALAKTSKGGKFKVGNKEFTDTSSIEEGFADMDAWLKSREKEKGTGKFDKRKISTGTVYTRRMDDEDDEEVSTEPRKKGRPKGPAKGPERVTAKSYKYKAGRPTKTQEDLDTDGVMMTRQSNMSSEGVDRGEYDQEGDMAKDDLQSLAMAAKELHSILGDNENLPEWVQSKITKALDYINSSNQYMHQQKNDAEPVAEKAVSVAQRRAAGIAHAAQKGEIPKKELRGASKEMARMPKGELKKFAKTKETGLPKKVKKTEEGNDGNLANNAKPYDKVTQGDVVAGRLGKDEQGGKKKKEEKVDETTVAGSVATAPAGKKSSGGYNFGGGVYESYNRQFNKMLAEGMNVTVNMSTGQDGEPRKSITITADGAEADQLAQLLKMSGMHSQEQQACDTCGSSPCGCEELEENSPDWPTNTETSNNALQYSGGLNGPKSTGQTTTPVIASQLRRQSSMEEGVKIERSLFDLYKSFKNK